MWRRAMNSFNVVLIVLDTVRARNLSCYGYARQTTPHLDRLADESVVYENAFTTSSWSLPAHASLFTGLYPTQHGADDHYKYLKPVHRTLAEHLRAQGYRTVGICYNPYVGPATGLDRGFEQFTLRGRSRSKLFEWQVRQLAGKVRRTADAGARFVIEHARRALQDFASWERPFFLFCHYNECHTPYRYPNAFKKYLGSVTPRAVAQVNQNPWRLLANPALMNAHDFEITTALYDGALKYLDTQVSQVLRQLRALDLYDRTMVIITADHGENLGEHGRIGHQYCLYDTLLHVPLIVKYPKRGVAPARIREPVSLVDVVPTILELLGERANAPGDLRGYNLLAHPPQRNIFAEMSKPDLAPFLALYPNAETAPYDRSLRAVRTSQHKLIQGSDGLDELYDLDTDPDETYNLKESRPDLVNTLAAELDRWQDDLIPAMSTGEAPEFEVQVRERLRALGYLE